jgi:hypothetical protein
MEHNTTEAIETLAKILGESGTTIVGEYAWWFIWSSLSFIGLGAAILVVAIKWKQPDDWDFNPILLQLFVGFIGLLFIACNVGDLLAPNGIAIHQLIQDVRGG